MKSSFLTFVLLIASLAHSQQPAKSAGTVLLEAGKFAEARDVFEAELDADSANAGALAGEVAASEQLALEARRNGQSDDALRILLRARAYAPKDPRLLYDLGIQEDEMHLFQDADRTLATLEELRPDDPQVKYAVAHVKLDLGQLAAAKERMQAYLTAQPSDASAHFGLGRIYQLELDVESAQAEFRRSIELQPVQTEAYYQLGDIALGQGEFAAAIANFSKTLERNPQHGGALAGTGQAYFKLKQYTQAEQFLERAVVAAPDYEKSHYYLGLTLARLGRKEDSERELALATKLADEAGKKARSGLRLNPPATNP